MQVDALRVETRRLADALRVPLVDLEHIFGEVGVDADYLGRALLEGDPQGALSAVARRLAVPRTEVVVALVKAVAPTGESSTAAQLSLALDAAARDLAARSAPAAETAPRIAVVDAHPEPPPVRRIPVETERSRPPSSDRARASEPSPEAAFAEFVAGTVPRLARRAMAVFVLAGVSLVALGLLGLARPDLFQRVVLYLVAVLFVLGGVGLVAGAFRLRRLASQVVGLVENR